jgi:signal transduction histidine kinase
MAVSSSGVVGLAQHGFGRAREMSLQWKLGLVVMAGLLLLFGLFVALGEFFTEETAQNMAAERLGVARLTISLLDRQFERQFTQLEWVASHIDVEASPKSADGLAGDAEMLRMSEPTVSDVLVIDAHGHMVWSDPNDGLRLGPDLSQEPFVSTPLATGQRYASPVMPDPAGTGRPLVIFAVPITGPNKTPNGVLAVSFEMSESLSRILVSAANELGPGGHAELVDQDLRLVASNEPGHALGPAEHPTFYAPLLERSESAVGLTDPIGDEDPADRGQRHIMAFVPSSQVPWGLGLGGSESTFTATTARWRMYTLPLAALAPAITLFLVWQARRRVVAPLKNLTRSSQAIADGDLTTPISDRGDGEVHVLARNFDIMRRRLLQARDAEAELSRHKDEFLAIAAHELRTPVAALSALTQLQRSRIARGKWVDPGEALNDVHLHLDQLSRLVGQLLDSTRIQTGKLAIQPQSADLALLVRSAVESVQVVDAGDHPFELSLPASLPAVVDPMRFEQVAINLLDNAAKHSPPGRPAEVVLGYTETGDARLVVRDYGPGIPPADHERVFERYFQEVERDGGGRRHRGLGLGLFVSREIVNLHGGEIRVESPVGGGTAFVVTLPTGLA